MIIKNLLTNEEKRIYKNENGDYYIIDYYQCKRGIGDNAKEVIIFGIPKNKISHYLKSTNSIIKEDA